MGAGPSHLGRGELTYQVNYRQKKKVIGLCAIFEGLAGAAFFLLMHKSGEDTGALVSLEVSGRGIRLKIWKAGCGEIPTAGSFSELLPKFFRQDRLVSCA